MEQSAIDVGQGAGGPRPLEQFAHAHVTLKTLVPKLAHLPSNPFSVSNTNLMRSTCMGSSMTWKGRRQRGSGSTACVDVPAVSAQLVHDVRFYNEAHYEGI